MCTGTPSRPSPRTARSCSGPPTSKRWSYAVSKMYDEHLALALAEERGLKVTVLRLFNAYGPAQPPELVGRPARHVHRGTPRRRAGGDPRRRPPDADVHVRDRHGRRLRPGAPSAPRRAARSSTSAARRRSRSSSSPRRCRSTSRSRCRCGRRSSRTPTSRATTRTSATACPTRRRRRRCSASRRRCRLAEGLAEDGRLAPDAAGRRARRRAALASSGSGATGPATGAARIGPVAQRAQLVDDLGRAPRAERDVDGDPEQDQQDEAHCVRDALLDEERAGASTTTAIAPAAWATPAERSPEISRSDTSIARAVSQV